MSRNTDIKTEYDDFLTFFKSVEAGTWSFVSTTFATLSLEAGMDVKALSAPGQSPAPFLPYRPTRRRPGTGCITQVSEHCYEGKYSPRLPNGVRLIKSTYAPHLRRVRSKARRPHRRSQAGGR